MSAVSVSNKVKHFDNRSQLVYKLVTTVHEMKAEDRNQFKGNATLDFSIL